MNMEFDQAHRAIVRASVEKNTIELPTILSCLDFEGLECLEIGPGPLARLAIKLSGFTKHITCLENYDRTIREINKLIKSEGLEKRYLLNFTLRKIHINCLSGMIVLMLFMELGFLMF